MILEKLSLSQFRNFPKTELAFSKNLTLFVGQNGSGKTNILEAVRLLSIPKSFRAPSDVDLIRWESAFGRVEGFFEESSRERNVLFFVENKTPDAKRARIQKTCKVDTEKVSSVELMGNVLTVLFSPQEMNLISDPPRERRRYIDSVLCQVSSKYCHDLLEYKKIVAQRNKLLSNIIKGQASEDLLLFWDHSLIEVGSRLVNMRLEMFEFYNASINTYYAEMSAGSDDTLELVYGPVATKETFEEMIEKKRREELRTGYTVVGPHRDDFYFKFNDLNILECGSRGETRSALLALKKCEVLFIQAQTQKRPILLLDDVFSELDMQRQEQLIRFVEDTQTIITTTDIDHVKHLLPEDNILYHIKDGTVLENA